jgi:hypothetical protein
MEQKTIIAIKSFLLVVLVILAIAIYIHGRDLSCDKCKINFISSGILKDNSLEVKAEKINEYLNKGECYVGYDGTGYYTKD